MLPEVPMTSASVLVALAMIGGVPKSSRAGKVTSVPPPATALIAPPAAGGNRQPQDFSQRHSRRGKIEAEER